MSMSIKREVYNKTSIIQDVVPNATIWDLDITSVQMEELPDLLTRLRTSPTIVFAWVKGSKITLWINKDESVPKWNDLLIELGIDVVVGAKTAKRLARAFSPRDGVLKMDEDQINMEIVRGDEFAIETFSNEDDREALLDGLCIVSKSFAYKLGNLTGIARDKFRKCEGLSFSMIYSGGLLKAFAYIVNDDKMPVPGADIVTSNANIKSEMKTNNGSAWIAFDVFNAYRNPKTNAQMDIMLGRMLFDETTDTSFLADTLAKDKIRIINGDAARSLMEWDMPSLESKVESSNKVNEDFAALPDMTADMMARGLDYRQFPGLVDMLATAGANQWYSLSRKWGYYPLPCSIAVPVICESAAALLGDEITVDRGSIRSIRHGDVWVVNDQDFIEFIRLNAGGADEDDHYVLIFRLIDGQRKVIVARNPMGWREFTVLDYIDGDPYPTYTNVSGDTISFPEMPGKVTKTLFEALRDGEMRITGVGDLSPVAYPEVYGPEAITTIVSELVSGEAGNVGSIINAIVLAAGTRPSLLNSIPASMEEIIDTFVQGGATEAREHLMTWGESLIAEVGSTGQIDTSLWMRRSGGAKVTGGSLINGFFTRRQGINKALRDRFTNEVKAFGQQQAMAGGPLLVKLLEMFNIKRSDVTKSNHPMIKAVCQLEHVFRYNVSEAYRAARGDEFAPTEAKVNWGRLYQGHLDRIMALAGQDQAKAELIVLIDWMVCMSRPTSNNNRLTDRSIINAKVWPLFVQGLVRFGLAMNLEKAINGGNPWIQSWDVECKKCGKTGTLASRGNYATYILNNRKCKGCV